MSVALDIYEAGLRGAREGAPLRARTPDGTVLAVPLGRWLGPPTAEDERLLDRAHGPVLDVGCGPGRHVLALKRRGVLALGVDVSSVAVRLARRRGAPAMVGSVFAALPSAGRWRSALLLDGNIGIGGDPAALLRRVGSVLRADGRVLVEVEPPGERTRVELVQLECGGRLGDPFPWAWVGVEDVESFAGGLRLHDAWSDGDRWFAELLR